MYISPVVMAESPKKPKVEDIETEPGAEERFERTVRRMLTTPPQPRKAKSAKQRKPKSKPK